MEYLVEFFPYNAAVSSNLANGEKECFDYALELVRRSMVQYIRLLLTNLDDETRRNMFQSRTESGHSLVSYAIVWNQCDSLQELLRYNEVNLDQTMDIFSCTHGVYEKVNLLFLSAALGRHDCLLLLLLNSEIKSNQTVCGCTSLLASIKSRSVDCFKSLLHYCAEDLFLSNEAQRSCLMEACEYGMFTVVREILFYCEANNCLAEELQRTDLIGDNVLHSLCRYTGSNKKESIRMFLQLLNLGAPVATNKLGQHPIFLLIAQCTMSNLTRIASLLVRGFLLPQDFMNLLSEHFEDNGNDRDKEKNDRKIIYNSTLFSRNDLLRFISESYSRYFFDYCASSQQRPLAEKIAPFHAYIETFFVSTTKAMLPYCENPRKKFKNFMNNANFCSAATTTSRSMQSFSKTALLQGTRIQQHLSKLEADSVCHHLNIITASEKYFGSHGNITVQLLVNYSSVCLRKNVLRRLPKTINTNLLLLSVCFNELKKTAQIIPHSFCLQKRHIDFLTTTHFLLEHIRTFLEQLVELVEHRHHYNDFIDKEELRNLVENCTKCISAVLEFNFLESEIILKTYRPQREPFTETYTDQQSNVLLHPYIEAFVYAIKLDRSIANCERVLRFTRLFFNRVQLSNSSQKKKYNILHNVINSVIATCEEDATGELLSLLLKSGFDVEERDSNGNRPLHLTLASVFQLKRVVLVLLHAGAEVDVADSNGNIPIEVFEKLRLQQNAEYREIYEYRIWKKNITLQCVCANLIANNYPHLMPLLPQKLFTFVASHRKLNL